jgi:hypothetical protein
MIFAVDALPERTSAFTRLAQSRPTPSNASRFTRALAKAPTEGWAEILDQLDEIARLQDDWDGAGSPAPDGGVVAGARKLALTLKASEYPPPGRVTPSVNGTICFESRGADGYREIEVISPIEAEQSWVATGADLAAVTIIAIV